MEQLKKHLENAYKYISNLRVSGDAVDTVALARMELRQAYAEASKPAEQGDTEEVKQKTGETK